MDIDPSTEARLVTREVRASDRDGTPTRMVIASRSYPAEQADVWDALTHAKRIGQWFLPVGGDLKVGGRYQLEGDAGGVIESCLEPVSFSVTRESEGKTSWLTVHLAAAPRGTMLRLVHESPIDPEFWKKYGPGATGLGWDLALMALGEHIATGEEFGPDGEERFSDSANGAGFLRLAAADWSDAAIASGDDVDEARAAAERCAEFYTPDSTA